MKRRVPLLSLIFAGIYAAFVLSQLCYAGNSDVEIHVTPKKQTSTATSSNSGIFQGDKEQWAYEITIENKTFKDLANVDVTYQVFFSRENIGEKAVPKAERLKGSITVPVLRSHEKQTIKTDMVLLKNVQLIGDYYYPSGARAAAHDSLNGLWVRVMLGGQQFA